jgi:transposase
MDKKEDPEMRNGSGDELEFAAIVGWDWADKQHEISLRDMRTGKVEQCRVRQTPEDLREWVQKLRHRFGGAKIAVAIEQSRGPVIYALMVYDFIVLYPINPKSLARFREAIRPSRAKDDRSDGDLLMELISKHRDRFRPWKPDDEKVRELRLLVEYRRKTVNDLRRLTKRLKSQLKNYFPQALALAGDLGEELAWDFLARWPSLETVKKAGQETVTTFYKKHRCRRKTIAERIEQISQAIPLTTDQATVKAQILIVQNIVSQLPSLAESIRKLEERIAELYAEHPDREVFDSFPGAGKVLAPRLAIAWGMDRSRYELADELLRFSGIAPVTEASGNSKWIHRSFGRPKFLHQTFFEYAKQSINESGWAKAFYDQRKRMGHHRNHILRTLAFKWIRIMYRCWKDQTPYDETRYLAALEKRGSYLAKLTGKSDPQQCQQPGD